MDIKRDCTVMCLRLDISRVLVQHIVTAVLHLRYRNCLVKLTGPEIVKCIPLLSKHILCWVLRIILLEILNLGQCEIHDVISLICLFVYDLASHLCLSNLLLALLWWLIGVLGLIVKLAWLIEARASLRRWLGLLLELEFPFDRWEKHWAGVTLWRGCKLSSKKLLAMVSN